MATSTRPKEMGEFLYNKICRDYDDDWGASVVGVIGGQGAVKTACCLDIGEKKIKNHPNEKIFWHDTLGSPCQYRKAKFFPYKIFVEKGLDLKFKDITNDCIVHPDITFFRDAGELFDLSEYKTINVVYFNSRKSWVGFYNDKTREGLMEILMGSNEWQTIVFDEMESVFPADVDNQSEEKWWTWTNKIASEKVKECRKSRVGVVGNYHDPNAIYHSVLNKFMFHIWGFGSRPKNTRIKQSCVDQCNLGEFWIDHQGTRFGKIKVKTIYNPPMEKWIVKRV